MNSIEAIEGHRDVVSWFGQWPSFHDARIIDLVLCSNGVSNFSVLTFCWVNTGSCLLPGRMAQVTFRLRSLSQLRISGTIRNNVIYGMTFGRTEDGDMQIDIHGGVDDVLDGKLLCR